MGAQLSSTCTAGVLFAPYSTLTHTVAGMTEHIKGDSTTIVSPRRTEVPLAAAQRARYVCRVW